MCLNVNGHSCAEVSSGAAGKNTSFIPLGDKGLIKPLVIIFCTYTMQETIIASAFGKICSCTTWLCSKSIIKVAEREMCTLCEGRLSSMSTELSLRSQHSGSGGLWITFTSVSAGHRLRRRSVPLPRPGDQQLLKGRRRAIPTTADFAC